MGAMSEANSWVGERNWRDRESGPLSGSDWATFLEVYEKMQASVCCVCGKTTLSNAEANDGIAPNTCGRLVCMLANREIEPIGKDEE